ncbi:uncharacterized protein LOC134831775 [Culicoides brevitarsis]|uniref:uncharacterized protein LOC134831775 n=1 Tax=Culicoides brevitarsis TaxID=469753 RepID=UPI00307C7AC3
MAKLLAYHTLPQISDTFLGIAKDSQDDRVICTYGRNLIFIIELSTQKQVKSWKPEEKLLKRVVYDSDTEQYVGLFGERNIKCWTEDTSNISKVKRTKLLRPVHEFVVLDDGRLLILYGSSYCESLKSALETVKAKNEIDEPNRPEMTLREVSQAKVINGPNGKLVFSFFTKKTDDDEVLLSFVELDDEKLRPLRGYTRIRVTADGMEKLSACTFIESSQGMELVSVWNDSSLFIRHLDFNVDAEAPNSVGTFVTKLSVINPNERMTMIALRSDCVAIYAANSAQDGASVLLFNTQFKMVQSRQSFKVFFPQSQMFIVENNLFLMAGQNFAMIPFRYTKNKLSSLIGSQRNSELSVEDYEQGTLNEHGDFETALSYNPKDTATSLQTENGVVYYPKNNKKRNLRNQFATRTFEDAEELDEKMNFLYRDDVEVEIVENELLPAGHVAVRALQNARDSSQMHLQVEMLTSQLESCGAGEMEITERLLPLLLEAQATSDIIITLRRYLHVSEEMITRVLKYALKLPEDLGNSNSVDLLNVVLSCSFHTPTITPFLRSELDLSETLSLLKHLLTLYRAPLVKLEERPDNGTYYNDDKQIVEWVNVLIDSHYQQICISQDAEIMEIVKEWKKVIKSNVEAMRELNALRATLLKFAEGQDLNVNKQACRFYSVERIKIY